MSLFRSFVLLAACAAGAYAADAIKAFGLNWTAPVASDWKVETEDGAQVLKLLVAKPSLQPRRPSQFAVAQTPDYLKVTVEAEVRKEPEAARNRRTSVMIVYAYRDPDHFNYAHFSVDTAKQVAVHNGIFQVNGGDRYRISSDEGPATLTGEGWHKVRLVYDGSTGKVQVHVNGKTSPSMQAVDRKFPAGKIGVGSFFDLGDFRNVKITGMPAQ